MDSNHGIATANGHQKVDEVHILRGDGESVGLLIKEDIIVLRSLESRTGLMLGVGN